MGLGHYSSYVIVMEIIIPKFHRNPNEMVSSIYAGVVPGGRTVTSIRKVSADHNSMETTKVYGPGLPRGASGQIGVLVLGGMVTTLDEMEYIIAAKQEKKFVPKRSQGEISDMCHMINERRNEQILAARKLNHNTTPVAPKRKMRLHLPVGVRYAPTNVPGLRVLARI